MINFCSINDIDHLDLWISEALALKNKPFEHSILGKNKTLGLLFFNSSLRTRLSTQRAASHLGMNTITLNVSNETWAIEFDDGTIMNGSTAEHIKEAAAVLSQYCDIIGIRAFPKLIHKEEDERELVLKAFLTYAAVPILNLESSLEHPLQALTDAITIRQFATSQRPKVVLSWAPHTKLLPHAVANSFVMAMQKMDVDFVITNPKEYNLNAAITKNTPVIHDQEKAFENADFIYAKNWCTYEDYGKIVEPETNWMITQDKINAAKFMHCLPVRRNVVVEDKVLDGENSIVIEQSNNRTFAAQLVLKKLLENG